MQVRALLYTSTLTNAIMEAMARVEAAVMDALAHQTTLYPRPPPATFDDYPQQLAVASQPVHEALSLSGFSGKQWVQESTPAGSAHDFHVHRLNCKWISGYERAHGVMIRLRSDDCVSGSAGLTMVEAGTACAYTSLLRDCNCAM